MGTEGHGDMETQGDTRTEGHLDIGTWGHWSEVPLARGSQGMVTTQPEEHLNKAPDAIVRCLCRARSGTG